MLHKWYSLVKEKRSTRTDFLRAITKCFDIDSTKLAATEVVDSAYSCGFAHFGSRMMSTLYDLWQKTSLLSITEHKKKS